LHHADAQSQLAGTNATWLHTPLRTTCNASLSRRDEASHDRHFVIGDALHAVAETLLNHAHVADQFIKPCGSTLAAWSPAPHGAIERDVPSIMQAPSAAAA